MAASLHILKTPNEFIHWIYFVTSYTLSINEFVQKHRGIMGRLNEVIETIRNVSIIISDFTHMKIFNYKWGGTYTVQIEFQWQSWAGNPLSKSDRNSKRPNGFADSSRATPSFHQQNRCGNQKLFRVFSVSHHWQMYTAWYRGLVCDENNLVVSK